MTLPAMEVPVEPTGATELQESSSAPSRRVYHFGCGPWDPAWLQCLANAKVYTLLFALFVVVEGAIVSGLTSTAISTLETRYSFSSTAAALIATSFDITVTAVIIFVSYFGGRGHRARWLGVGCVLQGIGCLVFASPQFIFFNSVDPAASENRFQVCDSERNSTVECEATNSIAYGILLLGNILIGLGASPLFTVGISYLDELVHPKYISLHLAVIYLLQVLGPAIGFGVGGAFLTIYIDPWVSTSLQQTSTGYLGAWWIGFVLAGFLSFIIAIPFFMYPRLLKDAVEVAKAREEEMSKKGEIMPNPTAPVKEVITDFFVQLKRLFTNITFLLVMASVTISALSTQGLVTFGPKYVESQFFLTASTANLLVGGTAAASAAIGAALGSIALFFFKNPDRKGKNAALLTWVLGVIGLPFGLSYLLTCPTPQIVGINQRTTNGINSLPCAAQCGCNTSQYLPVCGADGFSYATPCSAGCTTTSNFNTSQPRFMDCGCIMEVLANSSNITGSGISLSSTATTGLCDTGQCQLVGPFLVLLGIGVLILYSRVVPLVFVTLRCVANKERPLSLGVVSFCGRLLGSIPGPLITGALFDSSCILRNELQERCGLVGNCLVYNNQELSIRSMSLFLVCIGVSNILGFLCWLSYRVPNKETEDQPIKEGLTDLTSL